jgi:uncharacterized protein YndB with AHSA1/START domain
MNTTLIAKVSGQLNAAPAKVWSALTDPEQIKKYLYGTNTETDWKVGSPILFKGEWEGAPYVDKGEIVAFEPEKKLQYTYLSSFTGLAEQPENYSIVTFELTPEGNETTLTILQTNFKDESHRDDSQANWGHVLEGLKELLEAS